MSVAKSSMLKSQQDILNKVSLDRKTHRSRLYTDEENGMTRGLESNAALPLEVTG